MMSTLTTITKTHDQEDTLVSWHTAVYCKMYADDVLEIINHDEPTFNVAEFAREEYRALYYAYAGPFADVREAKAAIKTIEDVPYKERRFEDTIPSPWKGPLHRLTRFNEKIS